MNTIFKITSMAVAALVMSGCNIYRQQVVLPTPYYPQEQTSTTSQTEQIQEQSAERQEQQNQGFRPTMDNKQTTSTKGGIVQRMPFPSAEYSSLARTGSGRVTGSIYLIGPGGNKVYGKHTRLYLNPVTSYSTQWYNKSYLGGAKMSKVDSRLFNYLKFTTSDSNGKYEFLNVPSGSYYLIGVVKCGTACGYDKVKNIRIAKKISVFGSNIKNVDLTKSVK
jgi:hypothetical protein